jgi:hypothetical protein
MSSIVSTGHPQDLHKELEKYVVQQLLHCKKYCMSMTQHIFLHK